MNDKFLYNYEFAEVPPDVEDQFNPIRDRFFEDPWFLVKLYAIEGKGQITDKEISEIIHSLIRFLAWSRLVLNDATQYQRIEHDTIWRLNKLTKIRMNHLRALFTREYNKHNNLLRQGYRGECMPLLMAKRLLR
jgi:hypothetical protein